MSTRISAARRLPVGAEPNGSGVSFRVWAPGHRAVSLVLEGGGEHPLSPEAEGYFSAVVTATAAGARYRYRLDGAPGVLPDPASRCQPEGLDGPSEVVDPGAFAWHDDDWPGLAATGQVLYELHVGTFAPEGTWAAAAARLGHLRDLGVTAVEMMPVHEFAGRFGWGYDVALPFAPTRNYGAPDDLRRFVDAAHAHGIGVILDVVYNHFGPGAVPPRYTTAYEHQGRENEWGRSIDFDGPHSGPVRDFFAANAVHWIAEYHFDGLRIDASQALVDSSPEHILARVVREARAAAPGRSLLIVSENERQDACQLRPPKMGGMGVDALWNDDFHHAAVAALTGRQEAYFHDTAGTPQEFVAAARHGFLFQGQRYDWQDAARGTPALDLPPAAFVHFLENHDQVANGPRSERLAARGAPARLRALTALLLLGPQTPLLFQGQEFAARTPFHYFADQGEEHAAGLRKGRLDFLAQFPSMRDPAAAAAMAEPASPQACADSRLDWRDVDRHPQVLALHRDLIALRRTDPAFASAGAVRGRVDGGVIGPAAFLLRWLDADPSANRLMLVNLGREQPVASIPDPLAAPPGGHLWRLAWSSEDAAYGGPGRRAVDLSRRFVLPADAALVFDAVPGSRRSLPSTDDLARWQAEIGAS